MRAANPATDLEVAVEGIGTFIFGRRKPEDVFKIRCRYAVLTESHYTESGAVADLGALGICTIQLLMVAAPEGFDLESLDPLMSDDWESTIARIFLALRAKELTFKPKKAAPVVPVEVAAPEVPAEVHEPAAEPHVADAADAADAATVATVEVPDDAEVAGDKGSRDLFR
jgi:hypothetical protein